MNDRSLKHGTALGTQPARAISDISAGVSTHSAWASAIAFGTSGGFSPTSAEKNHRASGARRWTQRVAPRLASQA